MPELPVTHQPLSGQSTQRRRRSGPRDGESTEARRFLLPFAFMFTVFVIYGSLVPLHFQRHAWEEAWALFSNIRYLNLGIGSRADWVANILLFVPLAFLWLGVFWHAKSIVWRIVATLFVLLTCVSLSVAIEFVQIFFPPRTVSLNDIYAETIGATVGVFLWWLVGASVTRWYLGWRAAEGPMGFAQRLLYGYLFLLFGYNLLPLDLTISPAEIYHKWHAGRIFLIPFISGQTELVPRLYGYLTDVLIWIPAGLLAGLCSRHKTTQIWLKLTSAAALIEFLQIFVYTRVTDTTDIFTAGIGSAIGIWLALRWRPEQPDAEQPETGANTGGLVAGTLLWLALIFVVFWFPFDFRTDGAFLRSRIDEITTRVPFAIYYFGTEYRAITEVFHKVGFFFPLGMLFVLLGAKVRTAPPLLRKIAVLAGVAIVAASVEVGQLFLPGKFSDLTDCALEMAGGWAGAALAWRILSMRHIRPAHVTAPPRKNPWLFAGGLVLMLALLLLAAKFIPTVPYNVRKLIAAEHPVVSALALACAIAWLLGFPAWAAMHLATGSHRPTRMLPLLLIHGIGAWILFRISAPLEMIHKIVGTPILDWPWEWESIGRFLSLFTLWSVVSFGAVLISVRTRLPRAGGFLRVWAVATLALLPVIYVVVIKEAATDNLVELLVGGGAPMAFMWVAAGVFMLALAGAQLACALGSGMRVGAMRGLLWGATSFPLTYFALHAGFEPYIIKYGQVFSAFQFLLSQDRAHYAAPTELLLRYGFAHGILLFAIAASQAPFLGHIVLSNASRTKPAAPKQERRLGPRGT
ncbi:VanZ family protein [Sulfurimicrobium lacus]|uniref:VanZ family protein n=1 Tax=Sulfurimicrobium lacus TaxID=2715678 RepID=UPI001563CCEA|nr:VanZ family protein [Sulfurimicrobium lacus]